MNEKKCTKCGKIFPATVEHFHRQKRYKKNVNRTAYYKLNAQCKSCVKKRNMAITEQKIKNKKERERIEAEKFKKQSKKRKDQFIKQKRKQLERYYEMKQNDKPAIYRILNIINNCAYVGQTAMVNQRIKTHKSALKNSKHSNPQLQEEYNKYGKEAFIFEVIEELPCDISKDVLLKKEGEQIKKHLKEGKKIYNCLT